MFGFFLAQLVSAHTQKDGPLPGAEQSAKSRALEAGAAAIQTRAPVDAINIYLSGFHPLRDNPIHQMEASHFCNQLNQDFTQCVLFDGDDSEARPDLIAGRDRRLGVDTAAKRTERADLAPLGQAAAGRLCATGTISGCQWKRGR